MNTEDTPVSITINGFRNMKEAEAFVRWYSCQGDQGLSLNITEENTIRQGNNECIEKK